MDQQVAATAVVEKGLCRRGVAGDNNDAVRRIEPEAEGIDHVLVPHWKCRDRDIAVSVDDARRDLVCIDLVTGCVFLVETVDPPVNVDLPRFEDVLGHRRYSLWAVDLKRLT